MTAGVVAAGNPDTAEAGARALRAGGNAVDAVVAAMLTATVSEPMLTGLGGAGLAILRVNGEHHVVDLFTDMPGLGRDAGRPVPRMQAVDIDFGPTTQRFFTGPSSVAVPTLPMGLARMHRRFGALPLAQLTEPAAKLAEDGVTIRPGFAWILEHLWGICLQSPQLAALMGRDGRPLRAGERYRNPDLAETMRAFGRDGERIFRQGPVADAILSAVGEDGLLTAEDLRCHEAALRTPLRYRYRDATVWLAGPPSVAGLLTLQALRELEDLGPMPPAMGAEQVRRLAAAMARAERTRSERMDRTLFLPGFVEGFLSAIAPEEEGEEWLSAPGAGHTTHISAADEHGNLAGITASLGESAGLVAEGTGVILNNFLGEADVNPAHVTRPAGHRLMTMCCPTLVERDDGTAFVIGTGGSSRIRSAVLHAIVYLIDHRMSPEQAAQAPRAHVEEGKLLVELADREPGFVSQLRDEHPDLREFAQRHLYFGGLNIAGAGPAGFLGGGDSRRSGQVIVATNSAHQ